MGLHVVADLLERQHGIFTRAQLIQAGAQQHDLQRWLRRRELVRILPGVFVTHTGPLTWWQRAWAAVLWAEPAALARSSALRAARGDVALASAKPSDADAIEVVIARGRRLQPPPWIVVHCGVALDQRVLWSAWPPRQRDDHAALDLAAHHLSTGAPGAHLDAAAALCEPVQSRRTTAARLQGALAVRGRIAHRAWLGAVIADLDSGVTSVLEQGYARRVERPHGLPSALCQVPVESGVRGYRDVVVLGQIIELDGRAFHRGAQQRDRDLERDLDAAVAGLGTLRLGRGQVFDRSCRTAGKVARLLTVHGWGGRPVACSPTCSALAVFNAP